MVRSGRSIGRLRPAELVTLAGVLALGVSLFFDWFELALTLPDGSVLDGLYELDTSFWSLSVTRWLVLLALCFSSAMLVANLASTPGLSVILATPTFLLGIAAAIALIQRTLNDPHGLDQTAWLCVALAGTVLITFGAFWAMRDEYVPPGFKRGPEPELLSVSG